MLSDRTLRRIGMIISVCTLCLAAGVLYSQFQKVDVLDALSEMKKLPLWRIGLVICLIIADYAVMTRYDAIALSFLHRKLPQARLLLASFIGTVFSINTNVVIGSSLRYRLYRRFGVPPHEIGVLIVLVISSFLLGFLTLGAVLFPFATFTLPPSLGAVPHFSLGVLGICCAIALGMIVALSAVQKKPLHILRWTLPPLHAGIVVRQIAWSMLEWSLSASVALLLLPHADVAPLTFLAMFLLCQFLGQISQAPAGLGVFEASMALSLSPFEEKAAVFAGLLSFRFFYYLVPFFIGAVTLAVQEAHHVRLSAALENGPKRHSPPSL